MNPEQPDKEVLDNLLKGALADDLPPDVAAGMRDRFDLFRERKIGPGHRSVIPGVLFWKSAWAALSVLVLVTGGLLQAVGSRNALADRVSAIGTFQSVSRRLAEADSMSCKARVPGEGEGERDYVFEWIKDIGTTVTVLRPDGTRLRTFRPVTTGRNSEPGLRDLAPLLSPADLEEIISGGWRIASFSREGGGDMGIYEAGSRDGSTTFEITIDFGSYLPVRIRCLRNSSSVSGRMGTTVWEARLDFKPKGVKP
jgi:hypothetical protein